MFKKKRSNFIDFKNDVALHKTNNVHEASFNSIGNWRATVSAPNKNYVVTAHNVSRKEAVDQFIDDARLLGGTLDQHNIRKLK